MRKSQFIFALMLGCSLAAMAKADTSKDNCERVAGEGNCYAIPNNPAWPTEGYSDTTYYALSGDAGNQTMTVYGPTSTEKNEDGSLKYTSSIPDMAFYDLQSRESTVPGGVTSLKTSGNVNIGDYAFMYAMGLTSVDLTGVQEIGGAAFAAATGLTSVDLTGVKRIEAQAFAFATGLTSANLTGVQTISDLIFQNATNLTSIVISDSLLDSSGNILGGAVRDGVYTGIKSTVFEGSGLNTIYCPEGNACGNSFTGLSKTPKVIPYSIENGQIKAGGKTYASLDDLASGNHIVKRIYTIDEANAVAGEVNTIRIRYR